MSFNPEKYMRDYKGNPYLDVKWRLVWFRDVHPNGCIKTWFEQIAGLIIARAEIIDEQGRVLATGSATFREAENPKIPWAGRVVEKAETAAIGRALAASGFGTQFDGDDGDDLADSPVERRQAQPESGVANVTFVTVEALENGSKVIVANNDIFTPTRKPYTEAGYDTADWMNIGDKQLQPPARVHWQLQGGFRTVTRVEKGK